MCLCLTVAGAAGEFLNLLFGAVPPLYCLRALSCLVPAVVMVF